MKTNFFCPGCSRKLAATWFISTSCTVYPISCKCGLKLRLEKAAIALSLLAMLPAAGMAFVVIPAALGLSGKEVTEPIFFALLALMAGIYLPTSWMLIVNICKWSIVEDEPAERH